VTFLRELCVTTHRDPSSVTVVMDTVVKMASIAKVKSVRLFARSNLDLSRMPLKFLICECHEILVSRVISPDLIYRIPGLFFFRQFKFSFLFICSV